MGFMDKLRLMMAQLAPTGAGGARAVVVSVGEPTRDEQGRLQSNLVLELIGEWADNVQAPVQCVLSADGAARLAPGLEVPVKADTETGDLTGIDVGAYECETHGGAPAPASKPPPKAPTLAAMGVNLDDATRTEPDAASLTPVEGVTMETWVAVQAGLIRDRVAPEGYEAYAAARGVPAGRWGAVDQAWNARCMSDWRLGAAYGEAIQEAREGS